MDVEDTGGNTPRSNNEDRPFMGVPPLLLGGPNRQYSSFQHMDDIPVIPQISTPPPYEGKSDTIRPADLQATSSEAQTSARPHNRREDIKIVVESPGIIGSSLSGIRALTNRFNRGKGTH